MVSFFKKDSKQTSNWHNWRSPLALGVFILLVSVSIWLLANAKSILANI
jgi:hypothetical protein